MMKTRHYTLGILLAITLTGCAITPLPPSHEMRSSSDGLSISPSAGANPKSYRDSTLSHPNYYFQETPESRAVQAGSTLHANLAACSFIQRYKLATNADFTSTTNMFKYRAHLLGAERVVFVQHFEIDAREAYEHLARDQIFWAAGTQSERSNYLSVLIGDLYDCPCNRDSCRTVN